MVKMMIKENAFNYLMNKRGSKGNWIEYFPLEMAEYYCHTMMKWKLMKNKEYLLYKNRMVDIPYITILEREKNGVCQCGDTETLSHIYSCQYKKNVIPYEKIFNGKESEQTEILKDLNQIWAEEMNWR